MTDSTNPTDQTDLLRQMWGNMGIPVPGMAVPTLDISELEKRIADLRTVEGWLKMNLNMLQLHIQGLAMQRTTLKTMQNLAQGSAQTTADDTATTNPALWPWNILQQVAQAVASTAAAPNEDAKNNKN